MTLFILIDDVQKSPRGYSILFIIFKLKYSKGI